jgi:hypothetical protein
MTRPQPKSCFATTPKKKDSVKRDREARSLKEGVMRHVRGTTKKALFL